jgi:nitroreductase
MKKLNNLMPKFLRRKLNLFISLIYDYRRYSKFAIGYKKKLSKNNLEAEITYLYHSIEKGLSNINFRPLFGRAVLDKLILKILYYNKNFKLPSSRVEEGVKTIHSYIKKHKELGYSMSDYEDRTKSFNTLSSLNSIINLNNETIMKNSFDFFNFEIFANSRHSIRDYSNDPIDHNLIYSSIRIAMSTPSVCNRQAWEVLVVNNNELISQILNLQGGFRGFGNNVKSLLVILTNIESFEGSVERNQMYIDGGMFGMNLLYSLHYFKLGACPLNACLKIKNEIKIHKLLKIKQNLKIIMFISVGGLNLVNNITPSVRDNYKQHFEVVN